jgi:hypothetical protein
MEYTGGANFGVSAAKSTGLGDGTEMNLPIVFKY